MADKKINQKLVELAKRQMNPNPPEPLERTERKSLTGILERDSDGKPILNLTVMWKKAVNTPTQESYDQVMKVYECGGWTWDDSSKTTLPTKRRIRWNDEKEETCIDAGVNYPSSDEGKFEYADKVWFEKFGCKIITPQEFYDSQNPPITQEMIDEVNTWFDENDKS